MRRPSLIFLGILFFLTFTLILSVDSSLNAVEPSRPDRDDTHSPNLLRNPSFEGSYSAYVPPNGHPDCPHGVCQTAQMASDWTPWWQSHNPQDDPWIIRMPEYKPAAPFENRIFDGQNAQQYFTFHSTHRAGFYQRVKVDRDCTYEFSIWGHAWSSTDDNPETSDVPLYQKVGIDPTGGTNWTKEEIEWSAARWQPNEFDLFTVTAVAFDDHITVFTFSEPEWPGKHNDVYWDKASLTKQGSVCDTNMDVTPDSEIELQTKFSEPKEISQTIHISLPNNPGISWQAELKSGGTLTPTLSATSGSPNEDLVVTVDSNGKSLGSYSTELTITSKPRLVGSPVTIPINLLIWDEMRVSPTEIASIVLDSEPRVISRTVHIDMPNNPGFTWQAVLEPGGTLTPDLSAGSGSPTEDLIITVDSTGKTPGRYSAEVTITSVPQLNGSPTTIPIVLIVAEQINEAYFPAIKLE